MFRIIILTLASLPFLVVGDQHILLDTTKESMLDWTRYPYGPKSPTPGWVEESFTNFEKGINWRSYVVCDVGYPNVNNWLWTPFITRHDANRIYIEVKFSLRNCDLFPGTALQCKETFSLLYYEFDAATREPPPWEPESYKQIDVIAADEGRFTNNNEVIINTETRSIDVTKKGVYFAFRDQGACLSLLAVKVYYLKCPEITIGFAHYPETATGALPSSIEKIEGKCVTNAVAVQQPHNLCTSDGSWSYNSGLCSCMAGYEADEAGMNCQACQVGHFKESAGEDKCQICPPHSQALFSGSVECRCTSGYYRSVEDSKRASCTRPPTAPQRLRFTILEGDTIRLEWDPPRDEGSRTDTKYSVVCASNCNRKLKFSPSSPVLTQTFVSVSNLKPGSAYVFQVRALNGVSDLSYVNDSVSEISVVADFKDRSFSSGAVTDLHVTDIKPTQITLKWYAPSDPAFQDTAEVYEVRYTIRHSNTSNVVITKRDTAEIKNLKENSEYVFQVRAQTQKGWGDFSKPIYESTGQVLDDDAVYMGDEANRDGSQVAVVVISSILVLVLIFVLALFLCKRRSSALKRTLKEQEAMKYQGVENTFVTETYPIVQTQLAGSSGIYNPFSNHKTYIDPHTYEDPNIAVKQFAKEIDSKFITIEAIIGGGEFGDVCRGRLSVPDRNDMLVAIKTLKPGSAEKAKIDFLTEASIMGQFEHPNVIFLQGVVTKANPIMIITEYMENGSLDTFLRANDGKFQVMQLVGMMRGIAYGMQYLAEMNYVHRDLAARNVLVNSQLVCKIADFGLSREIVNGDGNPDGAGGAYTTRGGKIPVRWTAPEAIAFRKFTSSSDVWSFGIVMWEVMSFGERPYWTWSNQDVIKAIEKGYRLPAPMDCPEAIHQLMLDAWQKERGHRPSFSSIVKTLDKLICCPETLKKLAASPTHLAYDVNGADYASFSSVDDWLASIKMSRYSANFRQSGLDEMGKVVKLSLAELVEMGVTLVGHQKKIMSSIQVMRTHISVNMSEGFLV